MADYDFPTPTATEAVIPNGAELVGVVNTAITNNLRLNTTPQISLPSLWRLAYHVNYSRGPLNVFKFELTGK